MYTPELITSLKPNEIFVFGSNLEGKHYGGAAKVAYAEFGAIWGVGLGLHGKSFAIPTMASPQTETDGPPFRLQNCEIRQFVDVFFIYAAYHPDLTFYVTPIGTGVARFPMCVIAKLFMLEPNQFGRDGYMERRLPSNVIIPVEFAEYLRDWKK